MKKRENKMYDMPDNTEIEKDYLSVTLDFIFNRDTIDYRGDEFIDPRFVVNF